MRIYSAITILLSREPYGGSRGGYDAPLSPPRALRPTSYVSVNPPSDFNGYSLIVSITFQYIFKQFFEAFGATKRPVQGFNRFPTNHEAVLREIPR